MHLILLNVVRLLWQLFSGELTLSGADAEPYAMKAAYAVAVGRELVAAKTTVPTSQARALRDVHSRFRSYEAVDWMYFILSTGEVVLHNRILADAFGMFMSLCAACRFLFLPNALSDADVSAVDSELKSFCFKFYSITYRGSWERTPLCRSTIAALLDIVPNLKACGPAWVYWQFPMEQYIGTLPKLVKSQSKPYKSLAFAVARAYKSELVPSFAELHAPEDGIEATGHRGWDTSASKRENSCPVWTLPSERCPPRETSLHFCTKQSWSR